MARFTFNLPDIGEGIAEAEIVAWHVAVGDEVPEDGRLADLMTDKATVEMESPVAGRVIEIAGEVGDVIAIGSPLVVLETEGAQSPAPASGKTSEALEEQVEAGTPAALDGARAVEEAEQIALTAPVKESRPEARPASPEAAGTRPETSSRAEAGAKILASPAVRKRAQDLGIDLSQVRPAEDGRVRHADLDAFLTYSHGGGYAPVGRARPDESIRVIGLRRRIAENMAASKRHIPHFTYVEECDVTELERVRAQLNGARGERGERAKLTLLPLLISAICRVLPDYPMLNARYDDEANVVTRRGAVHLGLATMTGAGLMVPVLRDAQARNLWQLAAEILRLSQAARDGTARADELSGSTFTLSSLGPLGGIVSTPVINRPEVAILAPNRIVERPMFVADELGGERLAKRKLMNLSISCDHRVVDGYDAAAFVQQVKHLLESPALLLTS
jgi:2-oxoisovalerate dehydrogenase E2 component (dihydrolipoyl transacylase)